jgi:phosphatidyl-myo-inositol dimannoside synthase
MLKGSRVLALVTDAFGGRGGIATYNRNLLSAICRHPAVREVVAIPRAVTYAVEPMPANLRFERSAAGSKFRYLKATLGLAATVERPAFILCSHLHLLPFARLLSLRFGVPVLPVVYGIEAWGPTRHASVNRMCRHLKAFVTIRDLTARRLVKWTGIEGAKSYYLPNCVDLNVFVPGPKRSDLLRRYGLEGRTVVMTAGRMDSLELNKGFDEIIETLPILSRDIPNISYLIMGDGDDRPRLEAKARALGVADRLAFTGYVEEASKVDHYRLADAVAMPGTGRNYDSYPYRFAFLEPLACGIPVVGTMLDDAAERSDPVSSALVIQVDPKDKADIARGICRALAHAGRGRPGAIEAFSFEAFERRAHAIVDDFVKGNGRNAMGATS